jgi:hypothetical protein
LTLVLSSIAFVSLTAVGALGQTEAPQDRPGKFLREPPPPDKCREQTGQPINMLVMGDSILWGQGLKEENKISFRVQKWLCEQSHRPVKVWREAHSGAIIGDPPKEAISYANNVTINQTSLDVISKHHPSPGATPPDVELGGEVNVDNPTLWAQLRHAVHSFEGKPVDFVLMDGCINDFAVVEHLLDQTMTTDEVRDRSKAMCYDRMRPFLQKALANFPQARFIVTGYYPVMTKKSSRNVLLRYLIGRFLARENQPWFSPNARERMFQNLTRISREFGEFTNNYLRQSIDEANAGGARITFVPVYEPPDSPFGKDRSGFAAPRDSSLLWTTRFNSTGLGGLNKFLYVLFKLNLRALDPNDQVHDDRKRQCKEANFDRKGRLKCGVAAFGHPNMKGVEEYVRRITFALQRWTETGAWLRAEKSQ